MIQRLKKMKENKKGFTLVELIVVLVILAILIALLVPSLTGYIDKARRKSILAEARQMQMAAQTAISEDYEKGNEGAYKTDDITVSSTATGLGKEIFDLGEMKTGATAVIKPTAKGKIGDGSTYTNKGYTATYKDSAWSITAPTS